MELKNCPFCGEHAVRVSHPGTNWDGAEKHINVGARHGLWYVGCPHTFFEGVVKHCEIAPASEWYVDLSEAEYNWNQRN